MKAIGNELQIEQETSMRFLDCPCCGSKRLRIFYKNSSPHEITTDKEFFFGSNKFIKDVHQCTDCGFGFQNSIEKDYEQHYLTFDSASPKQYQYLKIDYFQRLKNSITERVSEFHPSSILDLGAGDGTWIDQWESSIEKFATESSVSSIKTLSEKDVKVLGEKDWKTNKYSVISTLDFLEHVEDPFSLIKACYESLEEGGYLIVSVPSMDKILSRIFRTKYYLYCPMHLSYFTKSSLLLLLMKFFDPKQIQIYNAPSHKFSLKMALRWLALNTHLPESLDFIFPIGYSASLVGLCYKKPQQ